MNKEEKTTVSARKNMPIVTRITILALSALVICSVFIGLFAYLLNRNNIIEESTNRAVVIAQAVGNALSPRQYADIMLAQEINGYYVEYKAFLDKTYEDSRAAYIYIVDKNYATDVVYFAEGYPKNGRSDAEFMFGSTEAAEVFAEEMFETLKTGKSSASGVYDLGGYGKMVSGYSPVLDESGNALCVVGVDLTISEAMSSADRFGLFVALIIAVMCSIVAMVIVWYIKRYVGVPIKHLTEAADKIALGDIGVSIDNTNRGDEIGLLAAAFTRMITSTKELMRVIVKMAEGDLTQNIIPRSNEDSISFAFIKMIDITKKQVEVLEQIADGDLTSRVLHRSIMDSMCFAMERMIDNLNGIVSDIEVATAGVKSISEQTAQSAQALADSSAQQAATVEELSSSIALISQAASESVDMASKAAELSDDIKRNAQKGGRQMDELMNAIEEINKASTDINAVITTIKDIAFQTNVLALNAAVEAARAGESGKGFAVVADEVRNLAKKSATAAENTEALIATSAEKAQHGFRIAGETASSFTAIVEGINNSSQLVMDIAGFSEKQLRSIKEINDGISHVSMQQSSAAASESTLASKELGDRVEVLEELVSRFKLSPDNV